MAKDKRGPVGRTIEIPALKNPYLAMLMVCGHLPARSKVVRESLKAFKPMCANFGSGSNRQAAQLFGGGGGKLASTHLHINIFRLTVNHVKRISIHDPNARAQDIENAIAPLMGQRIALNITGIYFLPEKKIPKDRGFVGPSMQSDVYEDITFRQTGGKVTMVHGPAIEWMLRPDEKEVRVQIELSKSGRIEPDYLDRSQEDVDEVLRDFILD